MIVYDLGGGKFDVSLLSIDDGVFEVLATAGDTNLGGEDFDNRVIEYSVKQYKKTGTDVSSNLRALGKLKHEVEKAEACPFLPAIYAPQDRILRGWKRLLGDAYPRQV